MVVLVPLFGDEPCESPDLSLRHGNVLKHGRYLAGLERAQGNHMQHMPTADLIIAPSGSPGGDFA